MLQVRLGKTRRRKLDEQAALVDMSSAALSRSILVANLSYVAKKNEGECHSDTHFDGRGSSPVGGVQPRTLGLSL